MRDRVHSKLLRYQIYFQSFSKTLTAVTKSFDYAHLQEVRFYSYCYGIDVKFRTAAGTRSDKVWLIDYNNAGNNNFLAVNQYTVIENNNNKRPDVVLFINGLPLVVIELKNATDESADMYSAYQQLQTCEQTILSLFQYNCLMIATNGWFAKPELLALITAVL